MLKIDIDIYIQWMCCSFLLKSHISIQTLRITMGMVEWRSVISNSQEKCIILFFHLSLGVCLTWQAHNENVSYSKRKWKFSNLERCSKPSLFFPFFWGECGLNSRGFLSRLKVRRSTWVITLNINSDVFLFWRTVWMWKWIDKVLKSYC